MVGFGRELAREAQAEWREFYLDYATLKRSIKDCAEAAAAAGDRPALALLLDARKTIFQGLLDAEVLKVVGWYHRQSEELLEAVQRAAADAGSVCSPQQQQRMPRSADRAAALERVGAVLQGLIHRTTQLLQFVALNMTAIRKILKKFAKNVKGHTNEPIAGFLTLEIKHPDDPGWRVLQGTYLPAAVADDLQSMQQHPELLEAMAQLRQLFEGVRECRRQLLAVASMRIPSQGDRELSAIIGDMDAMQQAEEEAARHAALVRAAPWAERAAGMFEPPPPTEFAVATLAGLVLNNLSTLLFMANYTAVLPPTDALCVRIGVPDSYTGYIMAASDLAAIFTSVAISFWTQHSFKAPLLFSAVACLAGNVLFVLSYEWRSLAMLLLARLLNGLGSARAANRRYTADYVGRDKRTMASAAFVGSSNVGMALGPLLSLPLAYLPDGLRLWGLPVNHITAVGWVMALAWLAFLAAAAVWFAEPPKRMPIGLRRASLVMPDTGGSNIASGATSRTGSLLEEARQPLLGTLYSGVPADQLPDDGTDLGRSATDAELAPAGPLLPQVRRDKRQAAALPGGSGGGGWGEKRHRERAGGSWCATVPATLVCTLALFVQKMVQQSYLDALPVFTGILYQWRSSQKGLYLGLVSLAMAPVNISVGFASTWVSDRALVAGSLAGCLAFLLALAFAATSTLLYFGSGVLLFVATVVLEGSATSLMSKVIWRGFAQGVLNAGLLSTEAGTVGRFAGNGLLALAGKLTGLQDVEQLASFSRLLHLVLAAVCAALIAHMACNFGQLRV